MCQTTYGVTDSEIASAPFTWVISTEGVSGTWNAAYESWFDSTGSGSNYNGELMIWIDYNGGASPGGTKVGTITAGGHNWDVYFAEWWVNYIAYRIKDFADSVSLDVRDFIQDAVNRGYLGKNWYMHNMEAGFEIWSDGQGLTSRFYSASVAEGPYTSIREMYEPAKNAACVLGQNSPNPFNEATGIQYSLSVPAFVSIKIFDIYGTEVHTLVNKFQQSGTYTVYFESGGLPGGIYIYKMYVKDSIVDTRRMIIIR